MPAEPEEMQEDGDAEAESGGEDEYAKAFRVLRHAMADGDDEAGGEALKNAVKLCMNAEDEEPEEGGSEKPNLAVMLLGKKKKKD